MFCFGAGQDSKKDCELRVFIVLRRVILSRAKFNSAMSLAPDVSRDMTRRRAPGISWLRHREFGAPLTNLQSRLSAQQDLCLSEVEVPCGTFFKLTWLVLGEDPAARSHRVEQFTAL